MVKMGPKDSTSAAVEGSLMYSGPKTNEIVLETLLTIFDTVDLAMPNAFAT